MRTTTLLISFFLLFINSNLSAQKVDLDHQLLWRISSPDLEQDSYIYGTMHLQDPRVFNFSDSVYVKIGECEHFALEVHPDTIVKNLIVDPFNSKINQAVEESLFEEEVVDDLNDELKEKLGFDIGNISKENIDLIPLFLDKVFKKDKDKNTILDAHLYHIARILDRNIVGLESMKDHKRAIRTKANGEIPDIQEIIRLQKARKAFFKETLGLYEKGRVEELFEKGGYAGDEVLAYRNNVMVKSSIDFIEDGGLFMAVGAAHLPGEEGVIQLLRAKGYTVKPVKAAFSKKIINADLAEKELDWVVEENPIEGFSISIPDHPYNYLPPSMAGLMKVRSYPDLGLGHFFFYSVFPSVADEVNLKMLEDEVRERAKVNRFIKVTQADYSTYNGVDMLELSYNYGKTELQFRYFLNNNYVYAFGVTKMAKGKLDKGIVERFFSSVKFYDLEVSDIEEFTNEVGAYKLTTSVAPQKFVDVDDSEGSVTTTEYMNFFNPISQMLLCVAYTYNDAGNVLENTSFMIEGYEDNFRVSGDTLMYAKTEDELGFKEIHIEYADNTLLKARVFVRGNRMYQLLCTGPISEASRTNAIELLDGFENIDYLPFKAEEYEANNFSVMMPSAPKIDTMTNYYDLNSFSRKAIEYKSLDVNTGLNVWVIENHLIPYSTYENADSCFEGLKLNYEGYSDTIIAASKDEIAGTPTFTFQKRSTTCELDYRVKLILDGDKLYEVHVVQDSSEISELAVEQFIESFELKNKDLKPSTLLRDSSFVKELLKEGLFNSDTTAMKEAADAMYKFDFSEEERRGILNSFVASFDVNDPFMYHRDMLQSFTQMDLSSISSDLEGLYLYDGVSKKVQFKVLEMLIEEASEESILTAKSLLQKDTPQQDEDYQVVPIFYSAYDNLEAMKPLFPEIIELGTKDSTIMLSYLFSEMLEEEVIDYEMFSSIDGLIKESCQKYYDEIITSEDGQLWSAESNLLEMCQLASYSDDFKEGVEYAQYFLKDTSTYYYTMEGAKLLLRLGEQPDVSRFYESYTSNSALVEMYEIERLFSDVDILPDSMLTMSKYVVAASLQYPEEEEYIDSPTAVLLDSYSEDGKMHYYFTCDLDYDDIQIMIYTVIDEQDGVFEIPKYGDFFTEYVYIEDGDLEAAKEGVDFYYEGWVKE